MNEQVGEKRKSERSNLTVYFFTFIFLLSLSCKKSDEFIRNPKKFLETQNLPSYFLKLPYFGVNGRNGLKGFKKDTIVDIKGVYIKGKSGSLLRIFNKDGLYYVPLEDALPYNSETGLVEVQGKVKNNGESYLEAIKVKSFEDIMKIREIVEREYPVLLEKIKEQIHNPKAKLDLKDIKTWHLAASDDNILVFGRTYDLMYEFDIGILLEKRGDTYTLKKIYAREFFKGE